MRRVQISPRQPHKDRVKDAFSAAGDYDSRAIVQRRAAERLAARIGALDLPVHANICELGCGTGFLGLALGRRLPGATWLATDLSPEMVGRAKEGLGGDRRFQFAVVDAGRPEPLGAAAPFDLICSTFAAQWFSDLERVLAGLVRFLKPKGRILITTLADGTFAEWRRAHAELGLSPGAPTFPTAETLRRLEPAGLPAKLDICHDTERLASGKDFLSALRSVGATAPQQDHVALRPGEIRQVLRRFEMLGGVITYEIATLEFQASRRSR